ncbi:MAG: adenylate/guanylate cyclase domain-containing protein [Chloroflexota bacterium]
MPAPVAERRLVSVLFADLVGFTTLAESRDAEEVRDLLSRYFDLARDLIGRYGGTVEKFIGDAVMAVWGAPVAREDDPERAVRAAMELLDAIGGLGPGIAARAGVLTGEAAVTLGAVNQGMVAGDLVNTASRIQAAAPAGAVLVGEATMLATSRSIAYEPAGEQTLKGKASPVPAWRALRIVSELGGRNRQDGPEAPFIGRDTELRLLKELLGATGRERRARLVSITGQAGIGKSRLAREFSNWVDGVVEQVWWHAGRSPSYGEGVTFWALAEMVRSRCRLTEADDPATVRERVAATVAEWVPDAVEARRVEPALLALLGAGGSTVGQEELFAAWRTFFERLTAKGTVVLLFEDLQWADPGLMAFIDHVLDWSRSYPILVITLARPELLEMRPDWGAGRRSFFGIPLDPLPPDQMGELLLSLVPGLPDRAIRAVVERADGVPLYAVETVRMLVSQGRLRATDEGYEPVGDLDDIAVPTTLQALIGARLDALDPADRALLQDAAVLGQSFTVDALAAITGSEPAALEARLRALVRRELLTLDTDARSAERGQFAFVQALIREVAYSTIALRDRRAKHLAAARHFETLDDGAIAGALAAHYLAAYRSTPAGPERDALAAQARLALRAAADRAISLGSYEHALGFVADALDVTAEPIARVELTIEAGRLAGTSGHREQAEQLLRDALAQAETVGDERWVIRARADLATVLLNSRQVEAALAVLSPIEAELMELRDPERIAAAAQLARGLYFHRTDIAAAIAIADRVLTAAEHAGLIPVLADTLITKGTSLAFQGRFHEAMALLRGARDLAARHGLVVIELRALTNLSGFLAQDDEQAAFVMGREGYELADRLGIAGSRMLLLNNACTQADLLGEWGWYDAQIARELGAEHDGLDELGLLQLLRTQARRRGGDLSLAQQATYERLLSFQDEAERQFAELDGAVTEALAEGRHADLIAHTERGIAVDPQNLVTFLRAMIHGAAMSGDADALRRAFRHFDEAGVQGGTVDHCRAMARAALLALEGRRREATEAYLGVMVRLEETGIRFMAALAGLQIAARLPLEDAEVRAAVERARTILVGLDARPFLAQLDAVLGARAAANDAETAAPRASSTTLAAERAQAP